MTPKEVQYRVQWIMAPGDPKERGLVGTTTHYGDTPAAAALESARSISRTLSLQQRDQMFIVGVYGKDTDDENLLSDMEWDQKFRIYRGTFPCDITYRPLC